MTRFDAARRTGLMQDLLATLLRRPADLLPFNEVRERLQLKRIRDLGIQEVPLERIAGSVQREREFNRAFLPRDEALRERWREIEGLAEGGRGFPPVELYRVGDVDFVVDGHHRVSVARSMGLPTIEARVKEFTTSVPLPPDTSIEDLLLKEGLADFLDTTGLVPERPDEFRLTEPKGYERLLDHIAVHRYFRGKELGRHVTWPEAVASWRDTVYRPMVETIRQSGVLEEFPGKTETDLYLFVMDHLHNLRQRYRAARPSQALRHFRRSRRTEELSWSERIRRWFGKSNVDPPVHPHPGRKLTPELSPERIGVLAASLPGGLRDPGFANLLERIDDSPVFEGNAVTAYFRGPDAFGAMREAVDAAQQEVLAESYIWKDDETGMDALEALGRAAARGVAVRVLADWWGSVTTRRAYWKRMRQLGVEVRLFNPIFPHFLLSPFRDHRKIVVVDRRVAFTGGMNVADEYRGGSGASRGGPWRDSHARAEGPAAPEAAAVFWEAWSRAGGGPFVEIRPPIEGPAGPARIMVLDSRPGRGHGETASAFAAIAAASRDRLWITNAYFAPRQSTIGHLAETKARGVDVRLLLPGISDVPIVRHAGHGWFDALRRAGIRIFEYQPAILHAKTVVADDYVSVIGSSNIDFRSFHFNAECNFVVLDDQLTEVMAAQFEQDCAASVEIGEDWRRSFFHRVGDFLARKLGPFL